MHLSAHPLVPKVADQHTFLHARRRCAHMYPRLHTCTDKYLNTLFKYHQTLTGQKSLSPRWKRMIGTTDRVMGICSPTSTLPCLTLPINVCFIRTELLQL